MFLCLRLATLLLEFSIGVNALKKLYVKNKRNYCKGDLQACDGTLEKPFGSLEDVFLMLCGDEDIKNQENIEINLDINSSIQPYIIKGNYPTEKNRLMCDPFQNLKGFCSN